MIRIFETTAAGQWIARHLTSLLADDVAHEGGVEVHPAPDAGRVVAAMNGVTIHAGDKFQLGELLDTGTMLLGRRTWQKFSAIFPSQTMTSRAS